MKKNYFMLAATTMMLAACAQTDVVNEIAVEGTPQTIGFETFANKQTRATNEAENSTASTKQGLENLTNTIFEICMENQIKCFVPYENGKIISLIKRECFIISETNKDDGIEFTVKTNPEIENLLKDFLI